MKMCKFILFELANQSHYALLAYVSNGSHKSILAQCLNKFEIIGIRNLNSFLIGINENKKESEYRQLF